MERTFILIKPDGMCHVLDIRDTLLDANLRFVRFQTRYVTEDEVRRHYEAYVDYPFFPYALEYMLSGYVGLGVVEGDNAIERMRQMAGPTRPWEAGLDTLRARFGATRSQEEADQEAGNIRNALHCSDSPDTYDREVAVFFPYGVD